MTGRPAHMLALEGGQNSNMLAHHCCEFADMVNVGNPDNLKHTSAGAVMQGLLTKNLNVGA